MLSVEAQKSLFGSDHVDRGCEGYGECDCGREGEIE